MSRLCKSAVATCFGAVVAAALLCASPAAFAGDEDLEFQPDEVKRVPPSKTLERAAKLYDKGDYYTLPGA